MKKIPLEERYTQNQLLSLQHNEFLKKYADEEFIRKNAEMVILKSFFVGFDRLGRFIKISCGDEKSEKELMANIAESENGAWVWKNMRKKDCNLPFQVNQ